jgi:hypothetical protein
VIGKTSAQEIKPAAWTNVKMRNQSAIYMEVSKPHLQVESRPRKAGTYGSETEQECIQAGQRARRQRKSRGRRKRRMERAPASAQEENEFIEAHGFGGYGKWHLGIDDEEPKNTKKQYKFPYGDFERVHRCALLSAESRAGQYKHFDIERAAAHLHGMIEELEQKVA